MDRSPDLEAHAGHGPTDLLSRVDRALSAVEHGHKPIAGCGHLAAPKSVEHRPYRIVVLGQQVTPRAVAKLESAGSGVHDVGYHQRRQNLVEATALRTRNAVLGCQSIVIHGSSPTTHESWPGGTS